jgi:hypothetical protein
MSISTISPPPPPQATVRVIIKYAYLFKIILPFHMLEQIPMPLQYPPAEGSSGKLLARGVQIVDHVSKGFQFAALKKK